MACEQFRQTFMEIAMCAHFFNSGTADVFTLASIAGASPQLHESMLGVVQTSAHLECIKLQHQIAEETQRQNREKAARVARARVQAEMAAQRDKNKKKKTENPPKKAKKKPVLGDDDDEDDDEEDLEDMMDGEKGK